MNKRCFFQALVDVKCELLVNRVRVSLPIVRVKVYDTPYLRRRIHLHGPYK